MNREQAKEICEIIETHGIEVIKAYGEGKTIQHLNLDGEWVDCDMPISFSNNHSFRVKPEENHTIKQNTGENRIEGGVVSISGSVDTFRCWKCGRTLPVSERTNIIYASNPPRYSCKECEEIKKEKQYRTFKDCNELIEHYQKKYKSTAGCDIYFPSLYKPAVWVREKDTERDSLIVEYAPYGVTLGGEINRIGLQELFDNYTFLDGTPCGITE